MGKMIFVIDDEADVCEGMQAWLSEHGYKVRTALNGAAALECLKNFRPDLILLDITMPKKNGFEFLTDLKRNPRTSNIPVIMLTASTDARSILASQKLEAADYVTKPFKENELLKMIRKYDGDYYSSEKSLL